MKSEEQRKKLHTYIADLDDEKVLAMLTLLEDEVVYQVKSKYSESEKNEIRKAQQELLSGNSKTYTLAEARELFRVKKQG